MRDDIRQDSIKVLLVNPLTDYIQVWCSLKYPQMLERLQFFLSSEQNVAFLQFTANLCRRKV